MNCKDAEIFLYSYLDGELSDEDALDFELHLERCESCRQIYDFEYKMKEKLKGSLHFEMEEIKTPKHVVEKIRFKKRYLFEFSFLDTRKFQALAAILFSVIFISPSFVGYTTLSEENMRDYLNKIDNYSNNKKEIEKWLKNNCLYSMSSLNVDEKISIYPLGFSIKKDHPIFFYHYKGKKILYKRTINNINDNNLKVLRINNKNFYMERYKGLYNVYWYQNNILNSITTKLSEKELKKILLSIR